MNYQIEFEPVGRRGECGSNTSLLEFARELGVGIIGICGGQGTCGGCRIQFLEGIVSEPGEREKEIFTTEELAGGWRLACRTFPRSNCKIYIPAESMNTRQRMQTEAQETTVTPEPVVTTYKVKIAPPSLQDLRSDSTRILDALRKQNVACQKWDINVLGSVPTLIREGNREEQVAVRDGEIIALSRIAQPAIGLAVDAGTTKIAAYLIELNTGKTLASGAVMNPQISYGEDIISRMQAAMKSPEGATRLAALMTTAVNDLAAELCSGIQIRPDAILDSVIVGNTAIHHLMLHLPVKNLAYSPYVPVIAQAVDLKARDMGLHFAGGAYVHILPNIAGFVGADHVAVLLAAGVDNIEQPAIIIDIGTNTEVSLVNNGEIFSSSCASGPAFEGGHISCGMRAAGGAIEHLKIINGKFVYRTINDLSPSGLCGSGVLDAIAGLLQAGMIDESGRIVAGQPGNRKSGPQAECVISAENNRPAITLTQADIRELQLAKGAIRAGIQILLENAGLQEENIRRFIIAGAFGSYIDVASAVAVGMLPAIPLNRFQQVGNAAGLGARMALVSKSKRLAAGEIAGRVRYVELATAPGFAKTFAGAMYLGKYRIKNGRRELL